MYPTVDIFCSSITLTDTRHWQSISPLSTANIPARSHRVGSSLWYRTLKTRGFHVRAEFAVWGLHVKKSHKRLLILQSINDGIDKFQTTAAERRSNTTDRSGLFFRLWNARAAEIKHPFSTSFGNFWWLVPGRRDNTLVDHAHRMLWMVDLAVDERQVCIRVRLL